MNTKIEHELMMWAADKPQIIKDLLKARPPHILYQHTVTHQIMTLTGYHENNTLSVVVLGPDSPYRVFDVPPSELEPIYKRVDSFSCIDAAKAWVADFFRSQALAVSLSTMNG